MEKKTNNFFKENKMRNRNLIARHVEHTHEHAVTGNAHVRNFQRRDARLDSLCGFISIVYESIAFGTPIPLQTLRTIAIVSF